MNPMVQVADCQMVGFVIYKAGTATVKHSHFNGAHPIVYMLNQAASGLDT